MVKPNEICMKTDSCRGSKGRKNCQQTCAVHCEQMMKGGLQVRRIKAFLRKKKQHVLFTIKKKNSIFV